MSTRVAPPVVDFDNEAALFTLIGRIAHAVLRQTLPEDDLDDVVSDIVLECIEKRRANPEALRSEKLAGYVRRMAKARAMDFFRRVYRCEERDDEHVREVCARLEAWLDPEVRFETQELNDLLDRTVATLPERAAHAYSLVRDQGMSHRQAALILGVKEAAIASYVMRVQERFRRELEAQGILAGRPTASMSIPPSVDQQPAWRARA